MSKIVAEVEAEAKKIATEASEAEVKKVAAETSEAESSGAEKGAVFSEGIVETVDGIATGLFIEREVVRGANKKDYRNYFLRFNLRGRSSRVDFVPLDIGGYEVLDFVFGDALNAELILESYTVKDNRTGKITKRGMYYYARNIDDTGVYKAQIKPKETSDKNLLEMVLSSM
ncbi:MAG: hypothetical protein LBP62_02985 [Clostridiales bacterium]|jgi:hypothetical protein|nr:hypothetical protein [Clostridiales bacterium]